MAARAPRKVSSPGWNTSLTVPSFAISASRALSRRAAPSSEVACRSCPQACMRPQVAAKGSPDSSATGRASMSARSRMVGPASSSVAVPSPAAAACAPRPMSAITQEPSTAVRKGIPSSCRCCRTKALVCGRLSESSGIRCSSWRQSASSSEKARASPARSTIRRSVTCPPSSRCNMSTVSALLHCGACTGQRNRLFTIDERGGCYGVAPPHRETPNPKRVGSVWDWGRCDTAAGMAPRDQATTLP